MSSQTIYQNIFPKVLSCSYYRGKNLSGLLPDYTLHSWFITWS